MKYEKLKMENVRITMLKVIAYTMIVFAAILTAAAAGFLFRERKLPFAQTSLKTAPSPLGETSSNASGEFAPDATLVQINCEKPNRLAKEKSPYLLQHACNPVNWYPWGEDAFAKAKKENKLILLSIGYSTCHWCHVMERESYNDEEVAKLLNAYFVAIKVDREERPDIDNVYMSVCQMLGQVCGWPLNIIMTPDKKPFFFATYIPKESRFGRAGMLTLLPQIHELWETQREKITAQAEQITAAIRQNALSYPGDDLNESTLKKAFSQLSVRYDKVNGGFGGAPKFPIPHNLLFLLRYWKRTGDAQALSMVEHTLQSMRRGGIYDHIGFGFHRYSTDAVWLVPHFEKMLYDQAMLAMAYTEAYQATGKEEYKQTALEIFAYVLRDMTSPEGGFYSAEDADSEEEEGKFYFFTAGEIKQVLGEKEGDFFAKIFNAKTSGESILHLKKPLSEVAKEWNVSEDALTKRIEEARKKLFFIRKKRIHPLKDNKILTDWNGLMIAAMAKAGQAFDEPKLTQAAKRAADFVLAKLRKPDGRLLHRFREGHAGLSSHIDDYAFFIWGLLEVYEATFDIKILRAALELNKDFLSRFWDEKDGGFFFTANDSEKLTARQKEIYDGAIPSGNSVAMLNLLRLARMTADTALEEKAAKLARAFSGSVGNSPAAYTQLMCAVDFSVGPSYEVVVVGDIKSQDTQTMLKMLRAQYAPNKVVLFRPKDEETPDISKLAPFTQFQSAKNNKATAYVCLNTVCKLPTNDISQMLKLLNAK